MLFAKKENILLLPFLFCFLFGILIPVLMTLGFSFFSIGETFTFVGLDNYKAIFHSPYFLWCFSFTLVFSIISTFLTLFLGFHIAYFLFQNFSYSIFLYALLLLPWMLPNSLSAKLWYQIIENYNILLSSWFPTWSSFFEGYFYDLFILIWITVWKTTPIIIFIFILSFHHIPKNILIQSVLNGNNGSKKFLKLHEKVISPIFSFTFIISFSEILNIFDILFVLSHGRSFENATTLTLMGYHMWILGDYTLSSVISILLLLLFIVLILFFILLKKIIFLYLRSK